MQIFKGILFFKPQTLQNQTNKLSAADWVLPAIEDVCKRYWILRDHTYAHTHKIPPPPSHTHRACTLATPGQESFQVRYDDSSLKSGNQETRAGSLVNAMLNEGQNRIQTLWARQVFRVAYWQIFWPMTSNKRLPSRMVWTSSGCMGDISVQIVWRESVKQLSTTPLNSFKQGKAWQRSFIEIRHVKKKSE